MYHIKDELEDEIEENGDNLPIFNSVLGIVESMNGFAYTYTLNEMDDRLFSRLMREVIGVL